MGRSNIGHVGRIQSDFDCSGAGRVASPGSLIGGRLIRHLSLSKIWAPRYRRGSCLSPHPYTKGHTPFSSKESDLEIIENFSIESKTDSVGPARIRNFIGYL